MVLATHRTNAPVQPAILVLIVSIPFASEDTQPILMSVAVTVLAVPLEIVHVILVIMGLIVNCGTAVVPFTVAQEHVRPVMEDAVLPINVIATLDTMVILARIGIV